MPEGYLLAALLVAVGVILLIGELLLPTHGLLGIVGAVAVLWAVFVCSQQNPWTGLALLVAVSLATPFAWGAAMKIWPNTPVGRRVMLPPLRSEQASPPVRIGQAGVTVSEMRPMGVCDFDGKRVEATSEQGIVAPGTNVKVIALVDNQPTVRVI